MSLLEAAFLSQLEAVLLDVASLGRLEAASLSLEEALSFCLLNREGALSLFIFVTLLENRERELDDSLFLLNGKRVLSMGKRAARRQKEAQPPDS